MRVLVTGGTGYLGRSLVERFASHGHQPIVYARRASSSGCHAATIDGDIRDATAVDRAVADCDAVCHLAALVSLWHRPPSVFDEINLDGLRHVMNAVERHGIDRLVYASSFLARAPRGRAGPLVANDYQRTKVAADVLITAAITRGLPIVRLYPGVVYGPGAATEGNLVGRLVRDHLAGRLPGIIGADRLWSFAFVSDVADAFVRAIERGRPGMSYLVGGPNESQMRMFEIVRDLTGRPLPRRIPYGIASAVGAFEELRARVTRRPPVLSRGAVEIFKYDWPLDSGDAVRDLGYRMPALADGIAALVGAS